MSPGQQSLPESLLLKLDSLNTDDTNSLILQVQCVLLETHSVEKLLSLKCHSSQNYCLKKLVYSMSIYNFKYRVLSNICMRCSDVFQAVGNSGDVEGTSQQQNQTNTMIPAWMLT